MPGLRAIPIPGIGEIKPGDSLPQKILAALRRGKRRLISGDILVVTHKVVSKAENAMQPLAKVKPSSRARKWARRHGHDPRAVEIALSQSRRVVRIGHGVLITQTRHGLVCANSGVDLSNVDGGKNALLLPRDPDRSARHLHRALRKRLGLHIPVIIADSFGRAWREGICEVAIGAAGLKVFRDFRGRRDPYGYRLRVTRQAIADELASTAGLVCGKLSRTPACIIRGFPYQRGHGGARDLIRPRRRDLFR